MSTEQWSWMNSPPGGFPLLVGHQPKHFWLVRVNLRISQVISLASFSLFPGKLSSKGGKNKSIYWDSPERFKAESFVASSLKSSPSHHYVCYFTVSKLPKLLDFFKKELSHFLFYSACLHGPKTFAKTNEYNRTPARVVFSLSLLNAEGGKQKVTNQTSVQNCCL